MTEETLAAAIKAIRNYTALPAWFAEILALFLIFIAWRFGLGVWIFDAIMASAGGGAGGAGPASGGLSPAAVAAATELGAGLWWPAWLHAYDSLRSYADNAIIAAGTITAVFEGGIMFLARKRIRLSKEEVRAELQPQVDAAVAAAAQAQTSATQAQAAAAQATARIDILEEENRLLREWRDMKEEENQRLREQLAQRENGNGNSGGNGNGNGAPAA